MLGKKKRLHAYAVICQWLETLSDSPLGVEVSADDVAEDKEEDGEENDPSNYDTGLCKIPPS